MERKEYRLTSNDRQAGSCQKKKINKEMKKKKKPADKTELLKSSNAETVLEQTYTSLPVFYTRPPLAGSLPLQRLFWLSPRFSSCYFSTLP